MGLHRLAQVVLGVPNLEQTAHYYRDFGLIGCRDDFGGWRLHTREGGEQLRLVSSARRRLVAMTVAADHTEDLNLIARRLDRSFELPFTLARHRLVATEPVTGTHVVVSVAPRIQPGAPAAPSPVLPVRPRKLGHVVIGTTDLATTERFFLDGLGFKLTDRITDTGAFLRCSTDHHNVLAVSAPVNFLHHTSWQVDDVDEVGRGAMAMLANNPERHVWGLGRHSAGSSFFWYLRDPAGNFAEYYSDMDCLPEDQPWTPGVLQDTQALLRWGPPPPPSFLRPEDLATLMIQAQPPARC